MTPAIVGDSGHKTGEWADPLIELVEIKGFDRLNHRAGRNLASGRSQWSRARLAGSASTETAVMTRLTPTNAPPCPMESPDQVR